MYTLTNNSKRPIHLDGAMVAPGESLEGVTEKQKERLRHTIASGDAEVVETAPAKTEAERKAREKAEKDAAK